MNDVLALLAEANPVRAEELTPLDLPGLRRRREPRRFVLAVAVVAVVLTATLVGVFAIGGGSKSTRPGRAAGPTGNNGPTGPQGPPGPTLAVPLPSGKHVSLPEAAEVLGAPLVLPDTPLVGPRNVGEAWAYGTGPMMGIAAVTYPAQGVMIQYLHPPEQTDPVAYYRAAAKEPGAQLINLDGTPALVFTPSPDRLRDEFGSVEFTVAGTEVLVLGHHDEATLEAIARSILGRQGAPPGTPGIIAPVRKPVDTSALSDAFGKPVVLPRTSLVQPSDAVSAWTEGDCAHFCSVRIWFPVGGLEVTYYRSVGTPETRAIFERVAQNVRFGDGEVVDLDGVPALMIENQDAEGIGSIAFVWQGARIEIDGYENAGVLTDLAQSMLDQLRGTSSGPFTASPGIDLFPIVPPQKQIDVPDASATLGAPVVLPDTATVQPGDAASASAEGQCPHATASSEDGHSGCAVWVRFPAKSLTIVYERPGGSGAGVEDGELAAVPGAHLVDLRGVPALAIERTAEGPSPGWLEFALDGTRVIISGDYDTATLRAIGQSIVDRSK